MRGEKSENNKTHNNNYPAMDKFIENISNRGSFCRQENI
jgi:hypothetical protein